MADMPCTCRDADAPPASGSDPEVEHLAHVLARLFGAVQPAPIDVRYATALVADLRERYILVPREGAEVTRMHQISDPDGGPWSTVAMDANLDSRVPFRHRYWTVVVGPLEDTP